MCYPIVAVPAIQLTNFSMERPGTHANSSTLQLTGTRSEQQHQHERPRSSHIRHLGIRLNHPMRIPTGRTHRGGRIPCPEGGSPVAREESGCAPKVDPNLS